MAMRRKERLISLEEAVNMINDNDTVGLERFCPIGPNYRQALEKGGSQIWECGEGVWHAGRADLYGNVQDMGGVFSDKILAKASRKGKGQGGGHFPSNHMY